MCQIFLFGQVKEKYSNASLKTRGEPKSSGPIYQGRTMNLVWKATDFKSSNFYCRELFSASINSCFCWSFMRSWGWKIQYWSGGISPS